MGGTIASLKRLITEATLGLSDLWVRIVPVITSYSCAKLVISLRRLGLLKSAGVLIVHRAF
jgi:hypothetical protein